MVVITADGEVTERRYSGGIDEIYGAAKCETFDIVRIADGLVMFVDDNGLSRNLDGGQPRWNWKATYLRLMQWMEQPHAIDWTAARKYLPPMIAGDVCILSVRPDGETVELSDAERTKVMGWLGELKEAR